MVLKTVGNFEGDKCDSSDNYVKKKKAIYIPYNNMQRKRTNYLVYTN